MPKSKKNKIAKVSKINSYGLTLKQIKPLREPQRQVFEMFYENNLLLHGYAGTGKTFLALYLGLKEVLEYNKYHNIVIVRSAVQGRDQGFMPGTEDEKMSYFETPYREITNDLCQRGDAYDILKNRGSIEFMSTSFIRGITLNRSIVIVDEVQNMTFEELDGITTRVGEGTKLILCGDFRQSDLKKHERAGLVSYMAVLGLMGKSVERVEFEKEDIVRSEFVKSYIIAKAELGL